MAADDLVGRLEAGFRYRRDVRQEDISSKARSTARRTATTSTIVRTTGHRPGVPPTRTFVGATAGSAGVRKATDSLPYHQTITEQHDGSAEFSDSSATSEG